MFESSCTSASLAPAAIRAAGGAAAQQPRIAVVIPSFNQAQYLELALRSVLDQDYAALECVVVDGGSTDGSVEIVKRYAPRLTAWVSEPDRGPYDAVDKAIALTDAEIIGWMNSDDAYLPGALTVVGEIFRHFPDINWLTSLNPVLLDERGLLVGSSHLPGFTREGFLSGEYLPAPSHFAFDYIQQESTFWRRSLWERAGRRIDPEFALAGDFVLWAQFFEHAELVGVAAPLAAFRIHREQMITRDRKAYYEECRGVLAKYGGRRGGALHRRIREIAVRLPAFLHAGASRLGVMRRARVVRWDLNVMEWRIESRFI